MSRPSHKEKLLSEGLRVVHEKGFGGASVRDIVQAAGVPQGSFTNHFASKEIFGLEVLDLYFANSREVIERTLRNESLEPLVRLRAYIDAQIDHIKLYDMKNGCLFGNFAAEATEQSERIRVRLNEIFSEVQKSIEFCLKAAGKTGAIAARRDYSELASFIIASLQGSILMAKTERSAKPVERFRQLLFSTILQK